MNKKRIIDESDLKVPYNYTPMSEKEAEIACGYDYDFEHDPTDNRSIEEMVNDISTIASGVNQKMINDFFRIH